MRLLTGICVIANLLPILCPLCRCEAQVILLEPDGSTTPFEAWSRHDTLSTYAHWDLFSSATNANAPDVGWFGLGNATLTESSGGTSGAFLTGSGNIYSLGGATSFELVAPAYDIGAGYATTVVLQTVTLGTELDMSSVQLSYDGGNQAIAPLSVEELGRTALGGFGGDLVSTLFTWEISGNPGEFLLQFAAVGNSMSLDQVVIDTFASPIAAGLPGDYDGSTIVDAADYALWRLQFGTAGPEADGNGDGRVDAADYTVWRDNLGATAGLQLNGSTAVPEPAAGQMVLCLAGMVLFCLGTDRYFARRDR